jgi:hypothetical protein
MQLNQSQILDLLSLIRPIELGIELTRLGNKHDGGYLVPSDFFKYIDTCFSCGISDDDSFDYDCANKGINVFQFDPTIQKSPRLHNLITFYKNAVGQYEGKKHLCFDQIFEITETISTNVMLKIDVEMGEWLAIDSSSKESLSKIKIITGEFHGFNALHLGNMYSGIYRVLKKLDELFIPIVVTPNDGDESLTVISGIPFPTCLEITYVSKAAFKKISDVKYSSIIRNNLSLSTTSNREPLLWNPSQFFD